MSSGHHVLVADGALHAWVAYSDIADVSKVIEASSALRKAVNQPWLWEEFAHSQRPRFLPLLAATQDSEQRPLDNLIPADIDLCASPAASVPWRSVCAVHDRMCRALHRAPTFVRISAREELVRQRIANLETTTIKFLAGEDALVIGHVGGAVSLWEILPADADAGNSSNQLTAIDSGSFTSGVTRSSVSLGTQSFASPGPFPSSSSPGPPLALPSQARRGPEMRVLGVFHTPIRKHEVQDLSVFPSAAVQPSVLLLQQSVWIAAAIGPSVYIYESVGKMQPERPTAALEHWQLRSALRHHGLFSRDDQVVFSVRLADCSLQRRHAITLGEDGVLRGWKFGDSRTDNELLWQHAVGEARQVAIDVLELPVQLSEQEHGEDPTERREQRQAFRSFTAVARADQRTLQLIDTALGDVIETISNVWPEAPNSLPQTAVFDTLGKTVMFSSITTVGDGLLARVDLAALSAAWSPMGSVSTTQSEAASQLPASLKERADRAELVSGSLTGPSRVLKTALASPLADVLVAFVRDGRDTDALEVWDRSAALGGQAGAPLHSVRVAPFLGNPRLVALGGRRLVLLDPSAVLKKGEFRFLEWHALRPRSPVERSAVMAHSPQENLGIGCCAGFFRWLPCLQLPAARRNVSLPA